MRETCIINLHFKNKFYIINEEQSKIIVLNTTKKGLTIYLLGFIKKF